MDMMDLDEKNDGTNNDNNSNNDDDEININENYILKELIGYKELFICILSCFKQPITNLELQIQFKELFKSRIITLSPIINNILKIFEVTNNNNNNNQNIVTTENGVTFL